ncbi:MAG: hydrogenase membrane subunit, partial [Methanoregula sp.]
DDHDLIFDSGTAEIRLVKFFEEYLYLPISRGATQAASFIVRMQNGCLDTYILYVFLAVVVVIVLLGVLL